MKKLAIAAIAILTAICAHAQGDANEYDVNMPEVIRIIASIFMIGLFMFFILSIMKRVFEYRLKNKIVEKGIPDSIASSLLQTPGEENKYTNIKWFALLAGIGAGLMIVNYTQPLGIHSLAIMAFSVAAGFLGYYLFINRVNK